MGLFTEKEKQYLQAQHTERLATSGKTAVPHVVPTGFHLDPETESIKVDGHAYRGHDWLYIRSLQANPRAAVVVDDLVTEPEWAPRGVTIKGPVRIHETGGKSLGPGFGPQRIELVKNWMASWDIDADPFAPRAPPRKRSGVNG